ncbi:MAG: ribonuclease D [Parvibaculales bacterium]
MSITLHKHDIPKGLDWGKSVAIDTEAMGLNPHRDRLCLVQLSTGDGKAHLVQFEKDNYNAPHLKALLADTKIEKIFHYARFDVALLHHYLGVETKPIWCTKIASRIARSYTDKHGLRDLCRELVNIDLSKQQQSSDWGAAELTKAQCQYAASDVLHLHKLQAILQAMLKRENRLQLAEACFTFIGWRAKLDLRGWAEQDIFAH